MFGTSRTEQAIRWTARSLSLFNTMILSLFFIGERFEISRILAREWVGLILFPAGAVIGFAIAWWKEALGGAITTVSLLAFYLVYGRLINGNIRQGWAFLMFASPGLLFILVSLLSRSRTHPSLRRRQRHA